MKGNFFIHVFMFLFIAVTAFGQSSEVYTVEVAEPGTFSANVVPDDVTRLKIVGMLDLPNDCVELYRFLSEQYIEELDLTDATFKKYDKDVELPSSGWYTYYVSCYQDNTFPVGLFQGLSFSGKLIMPSTLKSVKKNTFYGDNALGRGSEVVFSEGLDSLGQDAFCFSRIEKINLPNSLKYIGSGCFYSTSIKDLYMPDDIEEIDDSTLNTSFEHLHLPKNLKRIQWWSIAGMYKTLTFPASVEFVGYQSINSCPLLEELHCLAVVPPVCGHEGSPYYQLEPNYGDTFNDRIVEEVVLYVPKGSVEAYRSADGWNKFKDIREEADDYEEDLSWYDDGTASVGSVVSGRPAAEGVDVYTLQGVCVRRNAAPDSWNAGLSRGIYIVGGEKRIVK